MLTAVQLAQKEIDLQYLLNLREGKGEDGRGWSVSSYLCLFTYNLHFMKHTLQAEGFDDDEALDETIKKLDYDLKKARKREAEGDDGTVVSRTVHCPTVPLTASKARGAILPTCRHS